MKRIITIIAALLVALTAAPALAAPGDIDIRILTDNAGTMIFLGEIEATDNDEADFMVRVFDESMIEDSFDGMVVMSDALDDGTRMFGMLMDNGDMALLIITSGDEYVYMGMILTPDLQDGDGTTIGTLMAQVQRDGIDVDAPFGFVDLPVGDDTGFPSFNEGEL